MGGDSNRSIVKKFNTWKDSDDEVLVSGPSSGPSRTPVRMHTNTQRNMKATTSETESRDSTLTLHTHTHPASLCASSQLSLCVHVQVHVCDCLCVCVCGSIRMRMNFPGTAGCGGLFGFYSGSSLLPAPCLTDAAAAQGPTALPLLPSEKKHPTTDTQKQLLF